MHFERYPWCEEARNGLMRSFFSDENFDAEKEVREGVISGRMELWKVDGHSWAVTQTWNDLMFVWCYQGKNVRDFAKAMYRISQRNNLRAVRFATPHAGLPRMLKFLTPVEIEPGIYEIGVKTNG